MSKAQTTRTSTCNCGKVVINVTGVDKGSVLCHCSNCANASGSSFAHNHRFMPAELKVTKGEGDLKEYADTNTKSGNKLYRHFCGNCGSQLYLTNEAVKGFVALHSGSMQGEKTQPKFELFQENKSPWIGDVTGKSKL